MSFPAMGIVHTLTDFKIKEMNNPLATWYEIFHGEAKLAEITIPQFCREDEKTKLCIFLKDFSPLLCEMLVKWSRDVVERFFSETMAQFFPASAGDYELGFYEKYNQLYCTVQYTQAAHKRIFGKEREYTFAQTLSELMLPPKRLMFQENDEVWEKWEERRRRIAEAKELRRKKAKKRKSSDD